MEQINPGDRIRELRKEKHLTQAELGHRMPSDITDSTIAKLETGRMVLTVPYMLEIAQALGVPPAVLLGKQGADMGVRHVPIVVSLTGGGRGDFTKMNTMQAIPAHLTAPNLFSLRSMDFNLQSVLPSPGYAIVDPDELELVDGKHYIIYESDSQVSAMQFRAGPLAFIGGAGSEDERVLAIGSAPFTVVGKVVHIGCDM